MLTYVPKITAAKKFSKHPTSNCCKMYYQWEKHVQYFHSWIKKTLQSLKKRCNFSRIMASDSSALATHTDSRIVVLFCRTQELT